jgi:hypothetical protein
MPKYNPNFAPDLWNPLESAGLGADVAFELAL